MKKDTAITVATMEAGEDEEMNVTMRRANEIFRQNSNDWNLPFAQVDIEYTTFVDHLMVEGTQRERDLVYVAHFFHGAWKILHIDVLVQNRDVGDRDKEVVIGVHQALSRLGLLFILMNGIDINRKLIKKKLQQFQGVLC